MLPIELAGLGGAVVLSSEPVPNIARVVTHVTPDPATVRAVAAVPPLAKGRDGNAEERGGFGHGPEPVWLVHFILDDVEMSCEWRLGSAMSDSVVDLSTGAALSVVVAWLGCRA
jgi:hypothetical protein